MNLPQCFICSHHNNLVKIQRQWICANNDCAIKYYHQLDWLNSSSPSKKVGRPRLHSFSSENHRKAHYRQKTRDKITLNYYFKKKIIRKKDNLASHKT